VVITRSGSSAEVGQVTPWVGVDYLTSNYVP